MNQTSLPLACSKFNEAKLARVEAFVFTTVLLVGILLLFGALRRRAGCGFLGFLLLVFYTTASHAISYVMGLMSNAPFSHELFPLWAAMLLFAYGSADNMSAYTLQESQSSSKFMWGFILQFFWLALLFFQTRGVFLWPLVFLILLMFIKVAERGLALLFASKAPGIESVTMRLADYMKTEHELCTDDDAEPDPVSMKGYNYLVDITSVGIEDHRITKGVTLEQIWQCEGWVFKSTGGDRDGRLKDTCLSFGLFWLLLRKFAGYPLYESSQEKTWSFVRNGLLGDVNRVFRVIEIELNFLFDYFYTKHFAYYYSTYVMKLPSICLVAAFGLSTLYNLKSYKPKEDDTIVVLYRNHNIDVAVTLISVIAIVALETVQLVCLLATSRWFKLALLCYYVKKRVWESTGIVNKCIDLVTRVACAAPSCLTMCRPWQRMLNQYSLLESYKLVLNNFVVRMLQLNLRIPLSKLSRKELKPIALTPLLKNAVVSSLLTNGRQLTKGTASLKRHGVDSCLSWACEFEMMAEHILAWHVATSLCETHPGPRSRAAEDDFLVAIALSNYCAYLVAKAPRLLPDHAFKTKYIYNVVILDAKKLLSECKSRGDIYDKMVIGVGAADQADEAGPKTPLRCGARLASYLVHEMASCEKRWKLLADFWAELILFLAPSDDEMAHAECLANGGEFITHLWALLIHAGILTRDKPTSLVANINHASEHGNNFSPARAIPSTSGAFKRKNTF